MQPNAFAARAYNQNARSVGTPRSIEYQAFQRVTAMLRAAAEPEAPFEKALSAVLQNSKLWGVLATDLLSDNNSLPEALRAQLLSLAEFSRKHGLQVMSGKADLAPLIEINVTVMRGLRGEETAGRPAAPATAAAPVAASPAP